MLQNGVRMFGRRSRVYSSLCDIFHVMLLQAMPASLRALQAFGVSVEVLARLTALESLKLEDIVGDAVETTCGLSVLQRLTRLHLGDAEDAELRTFGAAPASARFAWAVRQCWCLELHVVYCLGSSRHC